MTATANPQEQPQVEAAARVTLRPIATPLSLGFLALSVGTFVLAGLQLSWIDTRESTSIGLILLAFVFPLQALSAVYGFMARDSVAGTGMGLLAGTWLATGAVLATTPPGGTSGALGLLLLGAGTAVVVPAVVATSSKGLAAAVMGAAGVRFLVSGAYEMSGAEGWKLAAGVFGLLLAALAVYAGLAFELEDTRRRTVLPTLRRGPGRQALDGSLADEVREVQHEAGVRRVL